MEKFRKILLALSIVYLSACSNIWSSKVHLKPPKKQYKETVVVLHGITRTNRETHLLAKRISEAGYDVFNITYPSTKDTIEGLADYIHQEFKKYGIREKETVDIVTHSLGGLLTRVYLKKYPMDNLDKVVMIAPPNQGSEVVDLLKDYKIYQNIYGPAGQQMDTDLKDIEYIFADVNYDLGIIAGDHSINFPIFYLFNGKHDGIVSVKNTKLKGMKDHITIPKSHVVAVYSKLSADLTISFLKDGKFDRKLID